MLLSLPEGTASLLRRSGIGGHPLEWRLPPIETYPNVVAFVQTIAGKLLLFAAFAALMKPLTGIWLEATVAAAVVSLAGAYRMYAAALCTAVLLARAPAWFEVEALRWAIWQEGMAGTLRTGYVVAGTLLAGAPLVWAALVLARRFRDHPLGRRPLLAQHLLCLSLLGLGAAQLLHGLPQVLLWSVTGTFAGYFWFIAYALIDQRQRTPAPVVWHFAAFHPYFMPSTMVPIGKGAAYWLRMEAKSAEELAVTQLKGLKLLAWAFLLERILWLFRRVVYDALGVTPLVRLFETHLDGGDVSCADGLFSVIANFPEQLLGIAVWGHVIIATARLSGFRLLRNTWRPLESRSIAEFWNRYFYYFKEVLVHVYFYPTYVRWFKGHPRLRLAFATFMAAGVGNFFFHFLLANDEIARLGPAEALARTQTYAFYCAVLAGGIVISQLRAHRPDPAAGLWRGRFRPSLGVALFYCFLSFFDGPQRHVSLAQHFGFLLNLFGTDRWMPVIG